MPGRDGTGPLGDGPMGPGRRRGNFGQWPNVETLGECICPKCGYLLPHQLGIPCNSVKCPKCSTEMIRKEEEIV